MMIQTLNKEIKGGGNGPRHDHIYANQQIKGRKKSLIIK